MGTVLVHDFCRKEGIEVDEDVIDRTPRNEAWVNYLWYMWDKLTEGNNRTKSKIITDPHLDMILATPAIEIVHRTFTSWRFIEEERIHSLLHTNEAIEKYLTTGVRLNVYSYLGIFQD